MVPTYLLSADERIKAAWQGNIRCMTWQNITYRSRSNIDSHGLELESLHEGVESVFASS